MANGKSDYYQNIILNFMFGNVTYTPPTTLYIALSTAAWSAASTGSSMSEVTGGSYTRVAVTNNTTNWPGASSGSTSNATVFTFPTATAGWGTIVSAYIVDASTAGNCIYGGDLAASRVINNGDTASFAASAVTATEA